MSCLTLYFKNVEAVHFGKDVLLTPYYLAQKLGCNVRILYPMKDTNRNLPSEHRGVRLIPICYHNRPIKNRYMRIIFTFLYLLRYFVPSRYGMLFHYYSLQTPLLGIFYKTLNPCGRLYIKLDADSLAIKKENDYKNSLQEFIYELIHWWFSKVVKCVSCETEIATNTIKQSQATCYKFRDNIIPMQNGFDEEQLQTLSINELTYEDKDNIILTVGRLGTYPKNTEMLLCALSQVNLKNWKFYLVGPIEGSFLPTIEAFYKSHPDAKENVVFTGHISDKRELWEFYNRAKVFVLTSRFESCALVFYEAKRFRNYILSTPVGAIYDIIDNNRYGETFEQEDVVALSSRLQAIIDGTKDLSKCYKCFEPSSLSWSTVVKPVADKLNSHIG